jgi:branched-chain amino acid transport system permease protein
MPTFERSLRWPIFILFVIAIGLYPALFPSNYSVGAGVLVGSMAVATVGFVLLVGYARQLAVGQPMFCTIGGYGSALLTTRAGVDPMTAMILSAAVAMVISYVIGLPILKLRGYVLAMASLSFQLILGFAATQAQSTTGGAAGVWGIPKFSVFGWHLDTDISYFYFVWFWVVLAIAVGLIIDRSAIGRALRAIASSERAATSVGMDIARYKLQMFVLSAGFASITGSLTVHFLRIMAPDVFGFQYSLSMITAVVAGGLNAVAGGVVGSAIVVGLREALRSVDLPQMEGVIMGALTVLILILFPRGVVGAFELLLARFRQSPDTASPERAPTDIDASKSPAELLGWDGVETGGDDVILQINSASSAFGNLRAVDNVDFMVSRGLITALIGSNGAGKTTMFDMISGLQTLDTGTITFEQKSIEKLQPHLIARLGMARSFQNLELFDNMTVLENVMCGTYRHTASGVLATISLMPRVGARERIARADAERCLAFVGMSEYRDRLPGALSFGQQRLVEIARALALKPKILLMDEPASGLNDSETEELGYLLQRICAAGATILLIEHDLRLVMGVSDHLVVMNHGQKIAEGEEQTVRNDPQVIAAYIGAR